MDQIQELNEKDLARLEVRRLTRFVTVTWLIYLVLYSLVFNPLYTHFSSDVLFRDAWWLDLIGLGCDLLDPILFIIVYPTTVYTLWRGGRFGFRLPIVFSLLTLFKFVFNYYVGWLFNVGALPRADVMWDDLSSGMGGTLLRMYLLEMLQYWLIIGFMMLHLWLYRRRSVKQDAEAALSGAPVTDEELLPLTRMFCFRNPVQRTLFDAGIIVLAARVLSHFIYQMSLIVYTGQTDGPVQFAADILSDVALGVIMYMAGIMIVNALYRRKK